jgi:hypothetical protein
LYSIHIVSYITVWYGTINNKGHYKITINWSDTPELISS